MQITKVLGLAAVGAMLVLARSDRACQRVVAQQSRRCAPPCGEDIKPATRRKCAGRHRHHRWHRHHHHRWHHRLDAVGEPATSHVMINRPFVHRGPVFTSVCRHETSAIAARCFRWSGSGEEVRHEDCWCRLLFAALARYAGPAAINSAAAAVAANQKRQTAGTLRSRPIFSARRYHRRYCRYGYRPYVSSLLPALLLRAAALLPAVSLLSPAPFAFGHRLRAVLAPGAASVLRLVSWPGAAAPTR